MALLVFNAKFILIIKLILVDNAVFFFVFGVLIYLCLGWCGDALTT